MAIEDYLGQENVEQVSAETVLPEIQAERGVEDLELQPRAWCPSGSASGGICAPARNERSSWMYRYRGNRSIGSLPIGEAVLPGTHNSGMDKKAPMTPSSETTQDVPVYEQLMAGIRVLDLRVEFFAGVSNPRRFSIYHSTNNGRTVEVDVLDALLRYRRSAGADNEIIILNFHLFRRFTDAAHDELANLIERKLGHSIVPVSCRTASVSQLWALNKNTVIAYNHGRRPRLFWEGVEQRWIGSNTPSNSQMAKFIREVGQESKTFGALKSVQAAYYSLPFFTPKDLSQDLMGWFAAGNSASPIQGHYIINTDWSLRQRLVDNVIFANGVRAEQRGAHVIYSSPRTSGARIQTRSYGIFEMVDGDWSQDLSFAVNDSSSTSIQVIRSDATYMSELTLGNGSKLEIKKGDRLVFRVPSYGPAQLVERFTT